MFFSEYFKVDANEIEGYGAVDISLVCDNPFFVDPMLIFNSHKKAYQQLHEEIIKYFHFLAKKAQQQLSPRDLNRWYNFKEVPNNWLGYSLEGNKGKALGKDYATFLYENIAFALDSNNISQGQHIEKVMLLYDGSGKDKISDLTVVLILSFLAEYTQKFAVKHIASEYCKKIKIKKAAFDYNTELFKTVEYILPVVPNKQNKFEYVLLMPFDILRGSEQSINRRDFYDCSDRIRETIDNSNLRSVISRYILDGIEQYEQRCKNNKKRPSDAGVRKAEKTAFVEAVKECPEIYDYYIRMKENEAEGIKSDCQAEVDKQKERFVYNSKRLIELFDTATYLSAYPVLNIKNEYDEARCRASYLKNLIESSQGKPYMYVGGERIFIENDLQRLFRLVWSGTSDKLNKVQTNTDRQAFSGRQSRQVIDFKLASNNRLPNVIKKDKVYDELECPSGSMLAIVTFAEHEMAKVKALIASKKLTHLIDKSIFIFNCQ